MAGLLDSISGAVHSLTDKLDNLVDNVVEKAIDRLHPKVHAIIDQHVDEFRDSTLSELPTTAEAQLRERAEASRWTRIIASVLVDHTDELVARLVERLRPDIVSASDGLSQQATDTIMDRLKDMLIDEKQEVARGGDEAVDAAAGQLQRSLDISNAGDIAASQDVNQDGGSRLTLDARMPGWESATRQMAHPLFESLENAIWAVVPDRIESAVKELLTGKPEAVETAARDVGEEAAAEESQGWGSWAADKAMDLVMGASSGPLRELLSRLVAQLEQSSMDAAFAQVRAQLADFHLLSRDQVPA